MNELVINELANELGIKVSQVKTVLELFEEGATIPFIARYRKEATGALDENQIKSINDLYSYYNNLLERKEAVIRLIDEKGLLTDELKNQILACTKLTEVEDLYRPYKEKKKTKASEAIKLGLEPLAKMIMAFPKKGSLEELSKNYLNESVKTTEDAIANASYIIAEWISDNAYYRKEIRNFIYKNGSVASKIKKDAQDEKKTYEMYYDFSEGVSKIAPHRVLAMDRGEKEKVLNVSIIPDAEKIINYLKRKELDGGEHKYFGAAVDDSYKRLIAPSIEREIRNELTENAQEQAIKIFKTNLHNLLMQPLIKDKVVIGLDPGYRTGCKVGVVDGTGKVLDTGVIYITHSEAQKKSAAEFIKNLIKKHDVDLISIGNGTASKETEIFTAELLKTIPGTKVKYLITNEAGASVYSASKLATEEFPDFDVTQRSAISIARRIQDPLAELVKIEPKAIGVGQYQHDMNQKRLAEALGGVVEDAVNNVGIDLNTASAPLLSYVSGISSAIAKNIVSYREENGRFTDRKQLKKVSKLGPKAFEQCAGFLRITDGKNILDNTSVHPESYDAAKMLLSECGFKDISSDGLKNLDEAVNKHGLKSLAQKLDIGVPTLKDIIKELQKPGRDPRDDIEQPLLRSDVMSIDDLKPGMIMTGTVRNVIDFGAFVDIGVHQDGLVHISQLSENYVKHPTDVVSIGDIVQVKIIDVDTKKNRISLSMNFKD